MARLPLVICLFIGLVSAADEGQAEPLTDEHKSLIARSVDTAIVTAIDAKVIRDDPKADAQDEIDRRAKMKMATNLCDNARGLVRLTDAEGSDYWNATVDYCYGVTLLYGSRKKDAAKLACPHLLNSIKLARQAAKGGEDAAAAKALLGKIGLDAESFC